ncbi:syndecan-4 [Syngnathoides biaculeatus]|uniref:syndecan-4 n=1 Tax=Syngnathoides biaculeatus TaxID=300417 RepID=UPI002ADDCF19|nr:syndecan-4 [Syngnathoides biaculeatus]
MSPFATWSNLLALGILLIFATLSSSESVRETETWMPLKATRAVAMATERHQNRELSGDFGFTDDEEDEKDDYYYDDDEMSGSGDVAVSDRSGEDRSPGRDWPPPTRRPDSDNEIPDRAAPSRPADEDAARNGNEIPPLRKGPPRGFDVLMSQAADARDDVFARTDVLAALICGGGVCLVLAVLPILLLVHRMKKKDEGSYELAKKPIYTKTPTAEIYA